MFQAKLGNVEDRLCTACGNKPAISPDSRSREEPSAATPAPASVLPESTRRHRSREKLKSDSRQKKSMNLIPKLVVGWILFMILLVWGVKRLWKQDHVALVKDETKNASHNPYHAEDQELLASSREEVVSNFLKFVTAETEVGRAQFVFSPATVAGAMAQYNRVNTAVKVDANDLSFGNSWVVRLGDRKDIEVHWNQSSGGVYETVFRQDNGEWKLDWLNFVRFSEIPWPLFLAGSDDSTGEFRLLAIKRGAKDRDSENIRLVFHSPRLGNPKDIGQGSPEFSIPLDSDHGRMLEAAFSEREAGRNPFGVAKTNLDPEGSIRVRVQIERKQLPNNTKEYQLKKIIACHWYSDDASGLEPAAQADQ